MGIIIIYLGHYVYKKTPGTEFSHLLCQVWSTAARRYAYLAIILMTTFPTYTVLQTAEIHLPHLIGSVYID